MSTFRKILHYISPYKFLVFTVILMSLLFAGLDVYTTVFVESFIDRALEQKDITLLLIVTTQYILVSTGREIAEYFLDIATGTLSGKFVLKIRRIIFEKLTSLPFSYYNYNDKGELIARFVNDAERAKEALEQMIHSIIHAFASIIYIILMFNRHLKLSLGFMVIVPGMLVIIKMFSRRLIFTGKRIQEQLAMFIIVMKDFIGGIRIVKSFATEKLEIDKLEKENKEYFNRHIENVKLKARFEFVEGWVMFLALAAISIYGGYEVINGNLSTGTFIFFFMALGELHENISDFIDILGKVNTYLYASDRVFQLLDIESETSKPQNSQLLENVEGKVTFDKVYFKYKGREDYALKNISFEALPGETIAIVGKSGSGKTTLANLILNLFKTSKGSIKIDGKNILDIDREHLAKFISVVPQETYLFSDTIANNIAYGADVSMEVVKEAADKAFVTEFTDSMADGLNTAIVEDSSNLSGGQKQRISIARAMVRDPKILVLDEATSALDNESSNLVSSAINRSMKDRTTFIITHKISSASLADKIIVMHKGEIKEMGTHDQLLSSSGIYSLLVEQQKVIKR